MPLLCLFRFYQFLPGLCVFLPSASCVASWLSLKLTLCCLAALLPAQASQTRYESFVNEYSQQGFNDPRQPMHICTDHLCQIIIHEMEVKIAKSGNYKGEVSTADAAIAMFQAVGLMGFRDANLLVSSRCEVGGGVSAAHF
eukprot:6208633-Pleurochrysis_carterae.AAC.2